jgi:glucuronate isomerase
MRKFLDENFLLYTKTAQKLYHNIAAKKPILDYHCHINPKDIAQDIAFENITRIWLGGDHYKWRLLRANGVDEKYITGTASDWEKFQKWAQTLEKIIGSPLYHWSHLELKRYFGYDGVLNDKTARKVWNICNKKLQGEDMSSKAIIKKSGVNLICTTDDPADTLQWHRQIQKDETFQTRVVPAWRPDRALNIEKPSFAEYIEKLGKVSRLNINSFAALKEAFKKRLDFFVSMGCRAADHGLEYIMYIPCTEKESEKIFTKKLNGNIITREDELKYKTAFMLFAGREYYKRDLVMELHYGCKRNNNTYMFNKIGPDTGYDCINNFTPSGQLADFLNALNMARGLPKTIIYSLNPNDNAAINSVIGCFQDGGVSGKIQHGAAWWFNDHKEGMLEHLTSLANGGVLSNFIGMLTDSRSLLSYARHEYFRRILCDFIGRLAENGEYPADMEPLSKIVGDICHDNAARYFGWS